MKGLILTTLFFLGAFTTNAQWTPLHSEIKADIKILSFPSSNVGFAVSDYDVWKTTDGGLTWANTFSSHIGVILSAFFLSDSIGWVGGGNLPAGYILKTTDGGITWKPQKNKINQIYSLFFVNKRTGWAVGNDATRGLHFIYKTTDGARTWQLKRSGPDYVRAVFFINKSLGWVAGDNSQIYKTMDGGSTWKRQPVQGVNHFCGVFAVSGDVAWAIVGFPGGACFNTRNGGKTWQQQSIPTHNSLHGISFTTPLHGWIVGDTGIILKTTDAGRHWRSEASPTMENLHSISFPRRGDGYIGGARGTVLKIGRN